MKMSSDASPVPPYRILLVDDNRNGLIARKILLQEQGYDVTACASPEEALQAFEREAFDLLVTDYRMPNMDGTEVIRAIRALKPDMPIVLVSGMVDVLGLNEKNTGADAVVCKNSHEVSHIVRAVNCLLRKAVPKKPARKQRAATAVKQGRA